jgi:hypothetical protein
MDDFLRFGIKTGGDGFSDLASKSVVGFLVEPQNQGRWFVSALGSKALGQFSSIWPQNWWQRFLRFGLKTGGGFLG